jgi:hypothetical protein
MNSLSDLCFETFIQHRRIPNDSIIDDVSSIEIRDQSETSTVVSSSEIVGLYSNKKGRRGMQKESEVEKRNPESNAVLDVLRNKKTLLSSIDFIEEQKTINVVFPKTKTVYQLLKLIDKTVVKPGNQEHIRSLILTALQRVSPPIEIIKSLTDAKNPLCKIPIGDAILFIETTPRALIFILKKNPQNVYLVNYNGRAQCFSFTDFFSNKKNEKPLDLFWTSSGRYITMTENKNPVFSFDLFSWRKTDHSRFLNKKCLFTKEPIRFLTRFDKVQFNPCLTESDRTVILDHRYRLKNCIVDKIFITLRNEELSEHLKFKKIMGWNK